MRRILIALLLLAGPLALAGCGNKGPLVRASAQPPAAPAPSPASTVSPAPPAVIPVSPEADGSGATP